MQFFISSLVRAHCVRLFSGRLAKGRIRLQVLQFRPDLTPQARHETIAHLAGEHQPLAFIVADDQCVQRVVWRVPARSRMPEPY
jgi:hypothetical protein